IMFCQALQNVKPELKIFEYRDHLLKKSLTTLLNLTDSKGAFYPINDAQKGMSYLSKELVAAVNVIYYYDGRDRSLLTIAKEQDKVQLDQSGLAVADAIMQNKSTPFTKKSMLFSDGFKGKDGAVSVLRSNTTGGDHSLLFKYGIHGMGHGHFDRLSYSLYQDDTEILQDYGAARWVNIDQKSGGVYLKENQTWAKQTIAHNTIVIDETSQFDGNTQTGDLNPSESYYFNVADPSIQIASALDKNAYPGVTLLRTLFLVQDDIFKAPVLIDIFGATGDTLMTIDLPFHFASQLMSSSVDVKVATTQLNVLGNKNGYQHLWREGSGLIGKPQYEISWFTKGKFTTLYGMSDLNDEIIFARLGANDPQFNLRRDALSIHRKVKKKDPVFVNVLSTHGTYDPVVEVPFHSYGPQVQIKLILNSEDYTIAEIVIGSKNKYTALIYKNNNNSTMLHEIDVDGVKYQWNQPIALQKEILK
ncbi:MAG: heparinase II/III family protein, partial [Saprospiraceae bacterium]